MRRTLLLALVITVSAQARTPEEKKALLEEQTTCANFVRFDEEHLYMGSGAYQRWGEFPRSPIPSQMTIANFDRTESKTIQTSDSTIDVIMDQGHAFILTYTGIEEWDMATSTKVADHATTASVSNEYKSHAEGWARLGDSVIIAHGSQGVTFFDLKTKKLTGSLELATAQAPLESQATAVAIIGNNAYVTMDSLSLVNEPPFPFKGIIAIDMVARKVVKQLEGLDPGVDALAAFGNKLVASFYGIPVWKYDITKFKGDKKLPNPEVRLFKFPEPGHPVGSAAMDEKFYYTCFLHHDVENSSTFVKPVAINRKQILLD